MTKISPPQRRSLLPLRRHSPLRPIHRILRVHPILIFGGIVSLLLLVLFFHSTNNTFFFPHPVYRIEQTPAAVAANDNDKTTTTLESRLRAALWCLFAGDALSSPTHWYYDGINQIITDYGTPGIVGYTKPKLHMERSIMNGSNLNGSGRWKGGAKFEKKEKGEVSIVGDVINHGKRKYWDPKERYHYHCTLSAGENTLEARLVRVLLQSIISNENKFSQSNFRQSYVTFMTTPQSHNDAYASTCHRMFFANYALKNLPLDQCPDNDSSNVDTIDGLVLPTVVALAASARGATLEEIAEEAVMAVGATRKSIVLERISRIWSRLVHTALWEDDFDAVRRELDVVAKELNVPTPSSLTIDQMEDEMASCGIVENLRTTINMISKYGGRQNEDPWRALLANANVGGENVHRGAILGVILGAMAGMERLPRELVGGLYDMEDIMMEIDEFVEAVMKK